MTERNRMGKIGATVVCLLLCGSMGMDASAQTRRPRRDVKRIVGETTDFWGAGAAFNGISGLHYEWGLRNKSGAVSRSTFSLLAGYSSRWASFESNTTFKKSDEWVHGVGLGIAFNNYLSSPDEGMVWSLGISGNVYFKNTDEPKNFSSQLKNYAVVALIGYRMKSASGFLITPQLGAGLMGSSFKSSTSSDINGLYVMLGASLSLKRK